MSDKNSHISIVTIARVFLNKYPWQTTFVLFALILSSLSEGVGLITILPLLNLVIGNDDTVNNELEQNSISVFNYLGVEPTLIMVLAIIAIGITLKAGFHLIAMSYVGIVASNFAMQYRIRLINSILMAKWNYFVTKPIGNITNAIGIEALRSSMLYVAFCNMLSSVIQISILLILAMFISIEITFIAAIAGVILIFFLRKIVTIAAVAGKRQADAFRTLSNKLTDGLQGIKPIKAMGLENLFAPILIDESKELMKSQSIQVVTKHGINDIREPIVAAMICIGLYYGIKIFDISFSTVLVMTILFYRIMNVFGKLQGEYQSICTSKSFFKSINDMIHEADESKEEQKGESEIVFNSISLKNVNFSYDDNEVLLAANLTIKKNKLTVLVGKSGSGKSTIADIICGMQRQYTGEVLVGDASLLDFNMNKWRRKIGYVPQENFLFHDSIFNNITMRDTEISREDVNNALNEVGAFDFISNLPEGIDTVVGERGVKFSGGQRQRISIARALVRNPELLILDEATASLDPETEKSIIGMVRKLTAKHTILAISHQKSILSSADVIYQLSDGKISKLD